MIIKLPLTAMLKGQIKTGNSEVICMSDLHSLKVLVWIKRCVCVWGGVHILPVSAWVLMSSTLEAKIKAPQKGDISQLSELHAEVVPKKYYKLSTPEHLESARRSLTAFANHLKRHGWQEKPDVLHATIQGLFSWMDYKKAHDSMHHTWILACLDLYKLNMTLRAFSVRI